MIPILVFVASEAVNKNYDTVFSAAQGFLTNTWCVDSSQIKKKKQLLLFYTSPTVFYKYIASFI